MNANLNTQSSVSGQTPITIAQLPYQKKAQETLALTAAGTASAFTAISIASALAYVGVHAAQSFVTSELGKQVKGTPGEGAAIAIMASTMISIVGLAISAAILTGGFVYKKMSPIQS